MNNNSYKTKRGGIGENNPHISRNILEVLVALLIVSSITIPLVGGFVDHSEKFSQEAFQVGMMTADDTKTITMEYSGEQFNWVIDGAVYDLRGSYTYVQDDLTMILRCNGSVFIIDGVEDTVTDAELEITGGEITGTVNGSPYTHEWEGTLYYPSNDGNYVMTTGAGLKYILPDTECRTIGRSTIDGRSRVCHLQGTIEDGFTISYFPPDTEPVIYQSNTEPTKISGYENLYTITELTFEDSEGQTITYNRFIIPASVIAIKDHNPLTDSLLTMILVIAIVGIIMAIAGTAIRNYKD